LLSSPFAEESSSQNTSEIVPGGEGDVGGEGELVAWRHGQAGGGAEGAQAERRGLPLNQLSRAHLGELRRLPSHGQLTELQTL